MKRKTTIIYFLSIVVLSSIFIGYMFYISRKYKRDNNYLAREYELITNNYSNLANNILTKSVLNFTALDNSLIIKNINKNDVTFDELISSGNLLILYYPESTCEKCYEYHVKEFTELAKTKINNMVILAPLKKIREIRAEFEPNTNLKIFYIRPTIEELKDIPLPCFFQISKDYYISNLFMPVKDDITLTYKYLELVSAK